MSKYYVENENLVEPKDSKKWSVTDLQELVEQAKNKEASKLLQASLATDERKKAEEMLATLSKAMAESTDII